MIFFVGMVPLPVNSINICTKNIGEILHEVYGVECEYIVGVDYEKVNQLLDEGNVVFCPYASYINGLIKVKPCENFILIYHNITPSKFFWFYSPHVAVRCLMGRMQLRQLNKNLKFVAVSKYNEEELKALGFKNTAMSPNIVAEYERVDCKKEDVPTLLYVGRIVENKNCVQLLKLVKELSIKNEGNVRLIIVGNWKKRSLYAIRFFSLLKKYRSKYGLCVEIKSGLKYEEIEKLYRESWLYVSCSGHEGFGLPCCESILHGTPAVYLPCGGQESVLNNYGLVKKKSEMVSYVCNLLQDETKRKELLDKQIEQVIPYTKAKVVESVKKVYGAYLV